MKRDFKEWFKTFRDNIANYEYYVNFSKAYSNIEKYKKELTILNSLIGSKNIEEDFKNIVMEYPEVLKCIPILLSVREKEIYAIDEDGFKTRNLPLEQYVIFMRKTGLFNLLESQLIGNLMDYVLGIEVGLDSNGRKNRGGHLMEDLVESFIQKSGFIKNETYFKEMTIKEITSKWNLDLSNISNNGKTEKRFDFVIKTPNMVYGIETNFYKTSGSKLNETARSYKNLATESHEVEGFTFIWFTDGLGWNNARHNLEETFDAMEHIYNINDLEKGILENIII